MVYFIWVLVNPGCLFMHHVFDMHMVYVGSYLSCVWPVCTVLYFQNSLYSRRIKIAREARETICISHPEKKPACRISTVLKPWRFFYSRLSYLQYSTHGFIYGFHIYGFMHYTALHYT